MHSQIIISSYKDPNWKLEPYSDSAFHPLSINIIGFAIGRVFAELDAKKHFSFPSRNSTSTPTLEAYSKILQCSNLTYTYIFWNSTSRAIRKYNFISVYHNIKKVFIITNFLFQNHMKIDMDIAHYMQLLAAYDISRWLRSCRILSLIVGNDIRENYASTLMPSYI